MVDEKGLIVNRCVGDSLPSGNQVLTNAYLRGRSELHLESVLESLSLLLVLR